ncbi:ketopantoate reductase family protein [Bradyrhizobium sp. WSM2254]|uniref:ketopantoate reductase family protein n=1 Tax=Bradyrhizobium sp. WSM2254 TaxID=1188263 RepID=UPI0003FEB6EA|nr:2-dehydropantoate 2-reductase [Bradyrhizobium sp. WSM2254]
MRICVYGAGAVGGHLAGRLAKSGADVSLIARGAHLAAIEKDGLRVETREGVLHSWPKATDDPKRLGPQDVVIVALKAPSLPQAAEGIGTLLRDDTLVLFAMNGIPWWYFHANGGALDGTKLPRIDVDGILWRTVRPERAIGTVAYTACTVTAPGVIHAENPRNRLILGRPDGKADPHLQSLADAMLASGLEAEVTPKIRDAIWTKLLMNLTGGALAILTGFAMKEAFSDPAVAAAAAAMAREGAAIAKALGCDPGDPEGGLARLSVSTHKQSILQDLERGRPMEVDAMLRVPLDLARLAKVSTPTLDLIIGLAAQRARSAGLYAGQN